MAPLVGELSAKLTERSHRRDAPCGCPHPPRQIGASFLSKCIRTHLGRISRRDRRPRRSAVSFRCHSPVKYVGADCNSSFSSVGRVANRRSKVRLRRQNNAFYALPCSRRSSSATGRDRRPRRSASAAFLRGSHRRYTFISSTSSASALSISLRSRFTDPFSAPKYALARKPLQCRHR